MELVCEFGLLPSKWPSWRGVARNAFRNPLRLSVYRRKAVGKVGRHTTDRVGEILTRQPQVPLGRMLSGVPLRAIHNLKSIHKFFDTGQLANKFPSHLP
jgi:hypothetical protein